VCVYNKKKCIYIYRYNSYIHVLQIDVNDVKDSPVALDTTLRLTLQETRCVRLALIEMQMRSIDRSWQWTKRVGQCARSAISDFAPRIEDTRTLANDERQAERQAGHQEIFECRHLYGQLRAGTVGAVFGKDRRRGREGRLCSASCIIHLHRPGLASATPARRARYICCSGSWNDISDPSLSRHLGDPPFRSLPPSVVSSSSTVAVAAVAAAAPRRSRFSRFSRLLRGSRCSPLALASVHPFSFPPWSILRVREPFARGGGTRVSSTCPPSGQTMSRDSDNSALV